MRPLLTSQECDSRALAKFILFSKPCHIKLTTTNKISLYVSTVKVQNKIKLVLVALEISISASSLAEPRSFYLKPSAQTYSLMWPVFFLFFFSLWQPICSAQKCSPSRKQMIFREQLYMASGPMEHRELTSVKSDAARHAKQGAENWRFVPPPQVKPVPPSWETISLIWHQLFPKKLQISNCKVFQRQKCNNIPATWFSPPHHSRHDFL